MYSIYKHSLYSRRTYIFRQWSVGGYSAQRHNSIFLFATENSQTRFPQTELLSNVDIFQFRRLRARCRGCCIGRHFYIVPVRQRGNTLGLGLVVPAVQIPHDVPWDQTNITWLQCGAGLMQSGVLVNAYFPFFY